MSQIQLSDHFTYGRLLRFTIPSICMMVFISIYSIVDGFFVSNFAGSNQFASVNLIMPFLMILSSVGFMAGTGGSALVGKTMGEGNIKRANKIFSLVVYSTIIVGAILLAIAQAVMPVAAKFLGASDEMLPYCVRYGRIVACGLIPFMLQNEFQAFFVTTEKPKLGLATTIITGCTNIVLDGVLVGIFKFGVSGAASATIISQAIGGFFPLLYFSFNKSSKLRLGKTSLNFKTLGTVSANGASELMTNISSSIVGMLYNWQLMRLIGANGVSAYGVIMYVMYIFIGVYFGYSIGSAPLISYNYGAANRKELHNLLIKSLYIIFIFAIILTALAELLAPILVKIFVGYDKELFNLTVHAFRIYCLSFLLCEYSIYSSSFFTALNNGIVSAIISFFRTLVAEALAVIFIPLIFGVNGIWSAIIIAEIMSFTLSLVFMIKLRKRYGY